MHSRSACGRYVKTKAKEWNWLVSKIAKFGECDALYRLPHDLDRMMINLIDCLSISKCRISSATDSTDSVKFDCSIRWKIKFKRTKEKTFWFFFSSTSKSKRVTPARVGNRVKEPRYFSARRVWEETRSTGKLAIKKWKLAAFREDRLCAMLWAQQCCSKIDFLP